VTNLLEVRDLTVAFPGPDGWMPVVTGVSFDVAPSTTLGLVGESGSGKTVTALSLLGLTASQGAKILSGSVKLDGEELVGLNEKRLSEIRGRDVGVIFQQPIRSLDPAFRVGYQIAETIRRHQKISKDAAWARAVELLDRVQIPEPDKRARYYPHQLSGGMCQRVMIAIALSCNPKLLIADEPTTALDVTVQSHILDLLRAIQADLGVALIFVSHDLGVIAEICQSALVMYAGEIVERSSIEDLFLRPRHPYTEGLLGSIPKPGQTKRYRAIQGNVPVAGHLPSGCHFHPRCAYAVAGRCDVTHPDLGDAMSTEYHDVANLVRCLRAGEISLTGMVAP